MKTVNYQDSLKDMLVPADRLIPHPDNDNNGDVDELITSMRTNSVYRPVYAQRSTGRILAGHTVYAALMELGADQIPVIWVDVSDAAARRILAGDNQIARLARRDDGLTLALLRRIEEESGLVGTGYQPEDIQTLLERLDDAGAAPLHVEFDARPPGSEGETRVQCPSCGYEWRLGHAE